MKLNRETSNAPKELLDLAEGMIQIAERNTDPPGQFLAYAYIVWPCLRAHLNSQISPHVWTLTPSKQSEFIHVET